jgi:hypothetical protein
MIRKQLVTVRLPGASMAPHSSTGACRPTRLENKGAKVLQRETNSDGKENKQEHSLSHLYTTDPSQMAKVGAPG